MQRNQADRRGLSHLEAPKSQPTLGRIKIFPDWSANMFLALKGFLKIRLGMLPMSPGWQGTLQIGGGFRT